MLALKIILCYSMNVAVTKAQGGVAHGALLRSMRKKDSHRHERIPFSSEDEKNLEAERSESARCRRGRGKKNECLHPLPSFRKSHSCLIDTAPEAGESRPFAVQKNRRSCPKERTAGHRQCVLFVGMGRAHPPHIIYSSDTMTTGLIRSPALSRIISSASCILSSP